MITRIWRGWTTPENADAYQRIVSQEVLPGIAARNLDGYHGAYLLRRDLGGEVEFATMMLFDSLEQVRGFAGEDYEVMRLHGMGPKAMRVLRDALRERGLSFREACADRLRALRPGQAEVETPHRLEPKVAPMVADSGQTAPRIPSTFPPPDARPRGTGRNRRGCQVTAEAVGIPFVHVTGDYGTMWGREGIRGETPLRL